MNQRPCLDKHLDSKTFRSYYYLKEELIAFCRSNGLPTSGGKIEISDRIAHYLDTGKVLSSKSLARTKTNVGDIDESSEIEPNYICSEKHRAFFREKIGNNFSFNVAFQKWLKSNSGKTYAQAIEAYHQIIENKKTGETVIDKQFEYNTYIRDFFIENQGVSLEDAIKCWRYKKGLKGHNRYEKTDLIALGNYT